MKPSSTNAKSLKIVSDGYGKVIKWEGGGQVPEELSGIYTSYREADKAISLFLAKKTKSN